VELPQPKLKVNLVHTSSKSATGSTENTVAQPKNGSEGGAPQGVGTGPPQPATAPPGTPKPACANPNVEATVTNPVQPDYPESARDLGLGAVTVEVEVTVGPSGNLITAKVYKSSSNMAIDQAALRAARQSTYSPKLVECSPTQGDYLFRADFQPD
jgi:TonB family protein